MRIGLPRILICDCNSTEHQIVIYADDDDGLVYCHIHLTKYGFLRRLKVIVKYIFGYKSRYGAWDEFIFKPEHADTLRMLSEYLSKQKNCSFYISGMDTSGKCNNCGKSENEH